MKHESTNITSVVGACSGGLAGPYEQTHKETASVAKKEWLRKLLYASLENGGNPWEKTGMAQHKPHAV